VARDILRTVLTKRIVFKPDPEAKVVRFFGELNIGRLFGVVPLERDGWWASRSTRCTRPVCSVSG
jgi:hypothetical protein